MYTFGFRGIKGFPKKALKVGLGSLIPSSVPGILLVKPHAKRETSRPQPLIWRVAVRRQTVCRQECNVLGTPPMPDAFAVGT